MPSLASLFYRPENKANGRPLKWNFEVLEMQRWDKPTDRAQRKDEKNGVKMFKDGKIMFNSRAMVIKM